MAFTIRVTESGGFEVKGETLRDKDEAIEVAVALRERLERRTHVVDRNGAINIDAVKDIADIVHRLPPEAKEVLLALVRLNGSAATEALQQALGEDNASAFGVRIKMFNRALRQLGIDPTRMLEKTGAGDKSKPTVYSIRHEWLDEVRRGLENAMKTWDSGQS